jgi:hypothetical protein
MRLPEAINLSLPSGGPPGQSWDFYVPMQPLTHSLQKQGHILSADVWLVVQDGVGNLNRKRILINDIPIWAQGGDPTNRTSAKFDSPKSV